LSDPVAEKAVATPNETRYNYTLENLFDFGINVKSKRIFQQIGSSSLPWPHQVRI
jgi:hypothetical protein